MLICLDVGGTAIKAATVAEDGALCSDIRSYPALSHLERGPLLDHMAKTVLDTARGMPFSGVRLAFPGPFDYEKGISYIRGLDKYDSLYGVSLKKELGRRLFPSEEDERSLLFSNDVTAFATGELRFGAAKKSRRAMFVCIGTGCGSAFSENGRIITAAEDKGLPAGGYIYNTPFLESVIDDYISKRGIMRLSKEMLGQALDGKELADRASGPSGERFAACFGVFADRLRDALSPFILAFSPDTLVLGGGIMPSAGLFTEPLRRACEENRCSLFVERETSKKTIIGLSAL